MASDFSARFDIRTTSMTHPRTILRLGLATVLLVVLAAVLWVSLRESSGIQPVLGAPRADAGSPGRAVDVEPTQGLDTRSKALDDVRSAATDLSTPPAIAITNANQRGEPVDDAQFLSTVDALFERSFHGPADQREAIRLFDSALARLDRATGKEQEDGSWRFDVPTSDAKNHVLLEASRFPDGSIRNAKLRVIRPEAPGFSGSPNDIESAELSVELRAKKGQPPRFSVSTSTRFRMGDAAIWNSYRGLDPVGMGGSTDFDDSGASWNEMTSQATEMDDGSPAWKVTHGKSSKSSDVADASQIERMTGSVGAILPR